MSDTRRDQLIDYIEKEFIGPDPIDWPGMIQSNGEEILTTDPPGPVILQAFCIQGKQPTPMQTPGKAKVFRWKFPKKRILESFPQANRENLQIFWKTPKSLSTAPTPTGSLQSASQYP